MALRAVPRALRVPEGAQVVFVGCGTSFHAAQTGGFAVQALEAVLAPPEADLMVCLSHEGGTPLTLEAARSFPGPKWLVTGAADSPLGELAEEVVVCTPEIERSWCHTASYTCAVAAVAAMRGEDISGLPAGVEGRPGFRSARSTVPAQAKILVAGAGRDWPTAQEAVLKLREGAWVSAGAHHTEQLLHGHLAAIDATVRAYSILLRAPAGQRSVRRMPLPPFVKNSGCGDDARSHDSSRGGHRPRSC